MKKILQPSFWVPVTVFIVLGFLTLLLMAGLRGDNWRENWPGHLDSVHMDQTEPLKGKRRYTDNYKRPDIINAFNLHKKISSTSEPQKIEVINRRTEPSLQAKLSNLLWSMNYQPASLSSGHQGLAGNCSACHSLTGNRFSEQCLGCHTAMAEKNDSEKGFHHNRKGEVCESCHIEHTANKVKLVPMHTFRHANTDYGLEGYHKRADCYDCHRNASLLKPNSVISANTTPRSKLRFSLQEFDNCQSCHPDPHKPTFGADCKKCHPLHLRWFQ